MENILVTGAGGFIGSAIVEELRRDRTNNVVGLMFDSHDFVSCSPNHCVYGDVRDASFMRRVIADYEITRVFHMAAQSIVRVCANDPLSAYDINVMGTVSLLEACRTVGANTVKSVVVSTSDKAFGHAKPPYTEDTVLDPKFTYEASKSCQDIITRSYFHNYGVPAKVVRCSNVYGPGDRNMSRLIPRTITRLVNGEAPVLYNGVHEFVREFLYVSDAVAAMCVVSKIGLAGEAYCVGGGGHYKILDVINELIGILGAGVEPKIETKSDNFKEIPEQWIDASKLNALGWSPVVSLEEGLKNCVRYYTREGLV